MSSGQTLVELAYDWLSRPDYTDVPKRLKAAKKALRRECGTWLSGNTVSGYGVGVKLSGGYSTNCPALQVFVRQKLLSSKLETPLIPPVLRLPHLDECILVDVVQQSPGTPAGNRYAGDGVRQNDRSIGPGSIGCFVTQRGSRSNIVYALTCWHVAAMGKPGGTPVEWCDDPDGYLPNTPFGRLDRYLSPVRSDSTGRVRDMALVRVNGDVETSNFNQAGLSIQGVRTTPLETGEPLRLFGFGTKELNHGTVTNPRAVNRIEYSDIGTVSFVDSIKTTGMSRKGDSGSIAVDSNNLGVGVLVGGDSESAEPWSAFVPLVDALAHFNVRVKPDSAVKRAITIREMAPDAVDLDILARTIWGEAEGEPQLGKVAVTNVITNRVHAGNSRRYGAGVKAVCRKNNGRYWQFSCWDPSQPRRAKLEGVTTQSESYRDCLDIAAKALKGELEDVTDGSLHYHAYWVSPSWSAGKNPVLVVGDHLFFNAVA